MASDSPPPAPSPESLLARYRATGGAAAFGALFDATSTVLFRVALTLVRDAATAEDVVQQTFVVALRRLARLDLGRPLMPWLLDVVRKEAAKARRQQRRTPAPDRLAAAAAARAAGDPSRDDAAVHAALEALEEPYRSAALLRWRYGLEPAAIAHVRAEPPGTTRSLLSRALDRLRAALGGVAPAVLVGAALVPRGLPRVRDALLREVAARGVSAAAPAAIGGAMVSAKHLGVAAVLLVVVGAGALAVPAWLDRARTAVEGPRATRGADPDPSASLARAPGTRAPAASATPAVDPAIAADAEAALEGPTGVIARSAWLVGRVLDTTARAVPGAIVRAHGRSDGRVFAREVRAGADGAYRVEAGATHGSPAPAPGARGVWVEVRAPGFATLDVEAPPLAAGATASMDLVLARGATVRGIVVDGETGAPLADVDVAFVPYCGPTLRSLGPDDRDVFRARPARRTVSAADGTFAFERIPCTAFHLVEAVGGGRGPIVGTVGAWRAGLAPAGDEVPAATEGEDVAARIELWPIGSIVGRVVDAAGRPIEGVSAWGWVDGRHGNAFPAPAFPAAPRNPVTTGADGRFLLPALPAPRAGAARARVLVYRELAFRGQGRVEERAEAATRLVAGQAIDVGDVVLPTSTAPRAEVVVRDGSGAPVPGARVHVNALPSERVTTDAAGRARVWWPAGDGGTRPELRAVVVDADGFARTVVPAHPLAGETLDLAVVLAPERRLAGRIVDAEGRPVADAGVLVANGRYPSERVFGPTGLGDFSVRIREPFDLEGPLLLAEVGSAEDGSFTVGGLPDAPVHLRVTVAGGPPVDVVGVAAGRTDVEVRVVRPPRAATCVVEGSVVDAETGALVLRPNVALAQAIGVDAYADLVSVGTFRFAAVAPGRYRLTVGAPGYLTIERAEFVVASTPAPPLRLALRRGATIVGRVVVPPSTPTRDLGVGIVRRSDTGRPAAWTPGVRLGEDRGFRLEGVAPGRYGVTVRAMSVPSPENPPLVSDPADDVVVEEGTRTVSFGGALVAAGSLCVHLDDPRLPEHDAEPLDLRAEAPRLSIVDERGRAVVDVRQPSRETPSEASYALLPVGRYRVRYTAPDGRVHEAEAVVTPAGQADVTLPGPR